MIAAPKTTRRWDTHPYRRIAAARYEAGQLEIEFGDGTRVSLPVADLLPARYRDPNWASVRCNPFEVIVPTAVGDCEIPWSAIRALTDPEYDAHLATAAAAQRRRIGQRVHELRTERGLDAEEVARRAGLSPEELARIEAGDPSIAFPPVQRLMTAMEGTLDDLIVTPGARFDE